MAPRRGGGSSSSSGSSISSCPDAFLTTIEQASFANDVVFFVVFLGIAIALCSFRKKSVAGKKLLGLPFIGVLFFFILSYICSIISTVLQQCGTTDYYSYYNWLIAITVFTYIAYWLLLVVVIFNLNSMLQQQLDHSKSIFKIIPAAITGLMGLLTCAVLGLRAYVLWAQTDRLSGSYRSYSNYYELVDSQQKLQAAYYSLYLVSLLASLGLALTTIMSLRRSGKPAGDLIGWTVALTMAMVLWVIILIVFVAWYLENVDYALETSVALSYIVNFGQALSCIFVLCIAKHASWRKPANTDPAAYQPQYGYNGNPNGQTQYYHQAPEFVGTTNAVKP